MSIFKAAIFDLDGVLVDTAKYHYFAWKRLADTLNITFTEEDNERLKGVNRMKCLDIILEIGGVSLGAEVKLELAEKKNNWYREYIHNMDKSGLLAGAEEYIHKLKSQGVLTAIGSASKNAKAILTRTGIIEAFDVIVDGNMVQNAKPDPEVFVKCANLLNITSDKCVVFEDSQAGIAAAKAAGMKTVGIGSEEILCEADFIFTNMLEVELPLF
ncbi:beta-phosphoglucomutase [Paenibacillus sp. FSL W8-0186]|uniref:Beta-phosphoglucomutase n=1 Tax=Paenibacillus woosongensis TaxID=307580 RepID=A0ABQ4MYV6_9BACL|nr:beta-phosphoglucomutase [Paenibacillus woosongensis]GIP61081.1 beta-phosphoglucomutase [Paenibacillus woosongensis]